MTKDNFDKFVEDLQKEIIEKEIEDYNERIVELFHNPKHWHQTTDEDFIVESKYKGTCGDLMQFFLEIDENDIIQKATFITDGCGASVATGEQTALMTEGKSLEEAEKIFPTQIDQALNGLPQDHKHCASLAVRTLRSAITKYRNSRSKK
ncbi:MAG: NifU-like protein [Promethearchaeota archaeon]|nr:MAG: NifU-like protein [Candidatus Lokiarchaeota archaeon]